MLKASLRSLLGHKVRLALTVLSIVAGVAFVAGTFVLTDSLNRTFESLFSATTDNIDAVVRGAEGETGLTGTTYAPLPISLDADLAEVDGVARVLPDLTGSAVVVGADGTAVRSGGAPTLAFAAFPDDPVVGLEEGRLPATADEVGLDPLTLERGNLAVGDVTTVVVGGEPRELTVVGTLGLRSGGSLAGATLAFFDPATAERYFAPDGTVASFSVVAADGAVEEDLLAGLREVVPAGAQVLTGQQVADEQTESLREALGFLTTFLLIFALVALLVGVFVILNTFSMLVAQRTRELALLRALGASQRQVTASLLGEAAVVGLVSSVIGIVVGVGLAAGLQALLGGFGLETDGSLPVGVRTVVVSLLVGVVVTVLAAWFPVHRARRIPPVAAMRDDVALPERGLRTRVVVGSALGLLAVVAFLAGAAAEGGGAAALVGGACLLVLLAVVVLVPVFARPALRLLGGLTRPFGTTGRLARDNAGRNPRRTAATASALMIGLALVGAVAVLAESAKESTAAVVESTVRAPLLLSTGGFLPFPPEASDAVAAVDGVAGVATLAATPASVGGEETFASAVTGTGVRESLEITTVEGDLAGLDGDGIAVSEPYAQDRGWSAGDQVALRLGTLEEQVPLVAVYEANQVAGDVLVSRSLYDAGTPAAQRGDFYAFLTLEPGADVGQVRTAVTDLVQPFAVVSVQDREEFTASQAAQIDQVLAIVYALLALSVVIAVIGIVNTLALSVVERTREIGLLRAVGMSRRQVRSTVRQESVLVSVYGALLGVALGIGLGVALQRVLVDQGLDRLVIPWAQFAAFVVVAALVGVLAALWPARRAARLDVLEAIANE